MGLGEGPVVIVDVDAASARYVVVALGLLRDQLRRDGVRGLPVGVERLIAELEAPEPRSEQADQAVDVGAGRGLFRACSMPTADIAEALDVSVRRARALCERDVLVAEMRGGRWYADPDSVEARRAEWPKSA
jgi:hypothetical protein